MPSVTAAADREQIVIGVDTHKDTHVAVALTAQGVFVDTLNFASTSLGIGQVMRWAAGLGEVTAWGVEGTGSYGAGLARALLAAGRPVIDVNHANRAARHVLGGKTDRIDAEAAARSVLTDYATAIPKTGDGPVELLRITRGARSSAVKARTAAMNQLRAVLVTAPPTLRDQLSALSPAALIDRCAKTRPGTATTIEAGVKRTLKALARRHQQLAAEIAEHTRELTRLVEHTATALLAEHGAGPDTAAALLIAAGDNPERLHSEAAFAALCGTNPIPASSGQTDRHRLNRGGDRQANAALHRIIIVRLVRHDETRAYMRSHVNPNGSNKLHVIRCLKRALARRLYPLIVQAVTPATQTMPAAA